jgi:hypothetical protein
LCPRDIGLEVFEAELQLVVVEPFGALVKSAALQLLNNEPEAFDLRLCLGEVGAFAASVRTIRCSVCTSSGRAVRSMSMSQILRRLVRFLTDQCAL